MSKAQYIFPRICIVDLTRKYNISQLILNLKAYHNKYFHVFNLTNIHLGDRINQTNLKWRGIPFSISQGVKILYKMDAYLSANQANTVVFCVNQQNCYLFALTLIKQYCQINIQSAKYSFKLKGLTQERALKVFASKLSLPETYFSSQFFKMYKEIKLLNPPVKILSSFQVFKVGFIPIIEVFRQTRYNQLQLVYDHNIQQQLSEYYLNLNRPLKTSLGTNHYDKKPQTKYMKKPVIIFGDVLIKCYSFCTLQKKLQFSLGFNTKNLIFQEQFDNQQGIIRFYYQDLFQNQKEQTKEAEVYIKIQNYCQNQDCSYQSQCQDCLQLIKKLPHRYDQIQCQLNKLHRDRNIQEIQKVFSLAASDFY